MSKFLFQPLKPGYMKLRTAGLASVKSAGFGMVRKDAKGNPRAHQGVDLAVEPGYRCYAVADGTVVSVGNSSSGYGRTITIKLKDNLFVFYAHLSRVDVKVNDKVIAGQVIGLSGCSGNAAGMSTIPKGSHLHFEVRTIASPGLGLGGRLNPIDYITLDE